MKKFTYLLLISLCVSMLSSMTVLAERCKYGSCTRQPVSGPNRDGYCYEHSPKNKAVKCKKYGCTSYAYHGSSYCTMHECGATSCKKEKLSGYGFCSTHKYMQSYFSSGNKKSSKSTYGSYRSKDPDDYDIEGFYYDHRDEFDDIDDVYDAFEGGDIGPDDF